MNNRKKILEGTMSSMKRRLRILIGFRKTLILAFLSACTLVALELNVHLSKVTGARLLPPSPWEKDLAHFRKSRNLSYYLDNIQLLIEPSSTPCSVEETGVLVVVPTAPARWRQRDAIRQTWGTRLRTYFLLGIGGPNINEELTDIYVEAKYKSDMVVFDLLDHYQNLTLKTALMLQWVSQRCPKVRFLYKVDDDVLINPWKLEEVLNDHPDAKLLGYARNDSYLDRREYSKWYIPRWLRQDDHLPQYLTGPGYLINGAHIKDILNAAYKVPIINLEDVYFTYLVAKSLKYNLTHDSRLSPYIPAIPWTIGCVYWSKVSIHSVEPEEMIEIWRNVEIIGKKYENQEDVCRFYERFLKRFVIWR